jgi:HD-GYP domain-containing protein (c-di-GMP phosphodiesterase class II)
MDSPPAEPTAPAGAETAQRPEALYQAARQEVGRILEAMVAGKPFDVEALREVAAAIVESLLTGDSLLVKALEAGETHLDLARHLVNVAIFAIKIGRGIGYEREDLQRLALAACLHDVGMLTVPRRILEKPGALDPEELAIVRQHPEKGFRMLQALGPGFEWLAKVGLQEQERADGGGYPRGLKGEEIDEYAMIVGLADVYESMTHSRASRTVFTPIEVMKEIIRAERRGFPDRILKGLIQGLSGFPAGSLVRLNSKEVARVVVTNPALPLRPVVEIFAGPTGERLAVPRRVDLAANTLLYITDALPPTTPV